MLQENVHLNPSGSNLVLVDSTRNTCCYFFPSEIALNLTINLISFTSEIDFALSTFILIH